MPPVLDTNTSVSGLIWGGVPGRLIDAAAAGTAQIISSLPLSDELPEDLFRKMFKGKLAEQGVGAANLFEGYAARVQLVVPPGDRLSNSRRSGRRDRAGDSRCRWRRRDSLRRYPSSRDRRVLRYTHCHANVAWW